MSAPTFPYMEQSAAIRDHLEEGSPPSYSSLFPDYPNERPAVGSINSDQYGYPPNAPYPQQQYVMSHEGTPLIGPMPVIVYPKQPREQRNVTTLIYVGSCPLCRVGVLEDEYPCIAICAAVLFFPFGLLCCLRLRQKRCNNCDYVVE